MKKKMIIFTSAGGGGHISATKAIQSYIGNEYEIKPVYIFNEIFQSIDPATLITFGKITGEDIYNFFLKRRWYATLNVIYNVGHWYFGLRTQAMKKLATQYLAHQKPDLVISVIPIVNNIILDAAQSNNIPFLLVPTDFDTATFVRDIKNPTYSKFGMTLASSDPLVTQKIKDANINSDRVFITGLPMRRDFFEQKNPEALKKEFNVPEGKPVIILMMGGQGNSSIKIFAQQLAILPISAHIIICIGKDTQIKKELEKFNFNPQVSIQIMGFTERISDLLAIADLLITKSGSVSFAEGIYMNVPMILDATATLLYWERLNHVLLEKYSWGVCLKHAGDLNKAIIEIVTNPAHYQTIKNSLIQLDKKRLDIQIEPIIQALIQ